MGYYYRLDENERVYSTDECLTDEEWKELRKRFHPDEEVDGYRVSTVFLGIDHCYDGGPPLLFETMVFDKDENGYDIYCERYPDIKSARAGHKKAIAWVKNKREKEKKMQSPELKIIKELIEQLRERDEFIDGVYAAWSDLVPELQWDIDLLRTHIDRDEEERCQETIDGLLDRVRDKLKEIPKKKEWE